MEKYNITLRTLNIGKCSAVSIWKIWFSNQKGCKRFKVVKGWKRANFQSLNSS